MGADPEGMRHLILGVLFVICAGAGITGFSVTSHIRENAGTFGIPNILLPAAAFVVSWMFVDWIWYPQNAALPIDVFARTWFSKAF